MNAELSTAGYLIARGALSEAECRELLALAEPLFLSQQPLEAKALLHADFLIEKSMALCRGLGFTVRSLGATLLNKLPGEPARALHDDWYYWPHPESGRRDPPRLGMLYFLSPATEESGCTRVIPGTHRRYFAPVHDDMADSRRSLADYPEQVLLPVAAGDLVVFDARLLHGSLPNQTSLNRIAVNTFMDIAPFLLDDSPEVSVRKAVT